MSAASLGCQEISPPIQGRRQSLFKSILSNEPHFGTKAIDVSRQAQRLAGRQRSCSYGQQVGTAGQLPEDLDNRSNRDAMA